MEVLVLLEVLDEELEASVPREPSALSEPLEPKLGSNAVTERETEPNPGGVADGLNFERNDESTAPESVTDPLGPLDLLVIDRSPPGGARITSPDVGDESGVTDIESDRLPDPRSVAEGGEPPGDGRPLPT